MKTHHPINFIFLFRTLAVILLLLWSDAIAAVSLEEYKMKIEGAWSLAVEIETSLKNDEIDHAQTRELVDHIRTSFRSAEHVEWPGGTVETSNGWLLERNETLAKETDMKKLLPIVTEIREHLPAIAFKLRELETAGTATRTKDEDKQKLAEILRREEYKKPQAAEETAFQRWMRQFLEWLEGLFRVPKPAENVSGYGGLGALLQVLLYVGLFTLLALLVYKLLPLVVPAARRTRKPKKKDRIILGEKLADDETSGDLIAEAERLAREGDLRGAIRKGYIALLCELSDRKVLGLARHKTNRDYLRDIRSRRDLHSRMKAVTDTFERHWYGYQDSDTSDWVRFRDDYERAIRAV